MMKLLPPSTLFLIGLAALTALAGCSNSSREMSTVQAQQAYSNSAVSGTYAFTYFGYNLQNSGDASSAAGTVQFDGSGNISGGSLSAQVGGGQVCQYAVKGTYSVQSSGSGTATLNTTTSDSSCTASPITIGMTVAQSGAAFVFGLSGNGAAGQMSGSAFKQ